LAISPTRKGRIVTEMSLMALDEDFFFLITAATAQWHDYEWLASAGRLRNRDRGPTDARSPARS
jgi:glycine cleavage system aminomethyltransferase T